MRNAGSTMVKLSFFAVGTFVGIRGFVHSIKFIRSLRAPGLRIRPLKFDGVFALDSRTSPGLSCGSWHGTGSWWIVAAVLLIALCLLTA